MGELLLFPALQLGRRQSRHVVGDRLLLAAAAFGDPGTLGRFAAFHLDFFFLPFE